MNEQQLAELSDARNVYAPGFDIPVAPTKADWQKHAHLKYLVANAPFSATPHARAFVGGMDFLARQPEFAAEAQATQVEYDRARLARKRDHLQQRLAAINVKEWGLPAAALKEIQHLRAGGRPEGTAANERTDPARSWVVVEERYGRLAVQGVRDDLAAMDAITRELDAVEAQIAGLRTEAEHEAQARAAKIKAAKVKPAPVEARPERDFTAELYASDRKLKRDMGPGAALVG